MEQFFRSLVPTDGEPISVERVMADLEHSKVQGKPVAVKNDPPQIFYSATPAILLTIQGEPVLAPIEKTDLQFVVNTNWDLFFDKPQKEYYLLEERKMADHARLERPLDTGCETPETTWRSCPTDREFRSP